MKKTAFNKDSFMDIESLTRGKHLKPFLCLIKELYHRNLDLPRENELENKLRGAFPYYTSDDLKNIISKSYQFLRGGKSKNIRHKLTDLYWFFFDSKYGTELAQISSPDLYHFSKKDYLLSVLKNGFIYPTVLSLDEYKSLIREYQGCLYDEKEEILNDFTIQSNWAESATKIKKMINSGKKLKAFETYLSEKSFIPAITCFTELPEDQITLHADHYGSYGIQFRKERIVIREYLFQNSEATPNYIRPIYYCDNSKCSVPWLILNRLRSQLGTSENREEIKKLMIDLALIKPIDQTLLNPKNIYSVLYEREWRFTSFDGLFSFEKQDVKRILVSKSEYQQWLEGKDDPALEEIIDYCKNKKIIVSKV